MAPWFSRVRTDNRWVIAAAGATMMMCLGTVYSWSIFARPLEAAFGWSSTVTMVPFSVAIFALGLGAVVGGRWQDAAGPRTVALCGVTLWSIGNVLAGVLTPKFGSLALDVSYGAIGGFGIGLGYVSPVAMVTKWFPDRRGLASGIVLTGFGVGAFVYNLILPHLVPALVGTHSAAVIQVALVVSGVVTAAVGGACAFVMHDPPTSYRAPHFIERRRVARDLAPSAVLRTRQFYMLWSMLFASVTAGMLVIANEIPIFSDLSSASSASAATMCGMLSLFNGVGRIVWGAISDRLSRPLSYAIILILQGGVFLLMTHLHAPLAVAAAFALVLMCNGGSFGIMPALNADYFGIKHVGANYGMLITAWGCAGVVGPILAARIRDLSGSYSGALLPVAFMLLCAAILPLTIGRLKRPDHAAHAAAEAAVRTQVLAHYARLVSFDLTRGDAPQFVSPLGSVAARAA